MNKRLTELAEQAGFQYIKDEGIGWAGNHNDSLPKFAELIVRECLEWCDAYSTINGTAQQIRDAIKKDFGVEE